MFEWLELVCAVVGAITLFEWVCYLYMVVNHMRHNKKLEKYGNESWALVTGGSDGIGLAIVKQLASQNFNIVVLSRDKTKLQELAKTIPETYGVKVRTVTRDILDCVENPIEFYGGIYKEVADLDISVLVNNVGTMNPGMLGSMELNKVLGANALNVWPVVFMCRYFLPSFLKRKGKSLILNVSSLLRVMPVSHHSMYTSGKAFMDCFSLILREEMKYLSRNKVEVVSLQPGHVKTNLAKNYAKHLNVSAEYEKFGSFCFQISPEECASVLLRNPGKVGYTAGHWKHQVMGVFLLMMPCVANRLSPLVKCLKTN